MSDVYKIINLQPDGEGHTTVDLGDLIMSLVTRYNYSAQCWTLDIFDSVGEPVLVGLMLIPNVDILKPYEELKKTYGALVLVQVATGAYMDADSLGETTKLLWFAPDEEIVLPT